jgi:hypothetical protein
MAGVQNAINTYNAATGSHLRSAQDLFRDWSVAVYLDWFTTTGVQDNNWTAQVVAHCDLTPGATTAGETTDGAGNWSTGSPATSSPPAT